jgi:hypothetical protein
VIGQSFSKLTDVGSVALDRRQEGRNRRLVGGLTLGQDGSGNGRGGEGKQREEDGLHLDCIWWLIWRVLEV